ncbi:MAG: hypothetical protein ACTS5V_09150 [Giesbergeria sp.]
MQHSENPVFDAPTVDELDALKRLEMGDITLPEALHQHLSGRLLEYGYVAPDAHGELSITPKGRGLIKRQEG